MTSEVRAAVFRPDDERIDDAAELLASLGATPVPDPMLAVDATGATPARGDWTVFTSKTGVELAAEAGWTPTETRVATIGPATADAARAEGWEVDLVPEEYSSAGLVDALPPAVGDDATVTVARSDHGSAVLLDGLREVGIETTETVLYRLVRPEGAGESTELAADGALEAALFTSSLTVEHFLEAAGERGVRPATVDGLGEAVVGCIGEPTAATAREHGIDVDVVPGEATFETLATTVVERAAPSHHEA
ncbi:uroporphyrinogen-III synthase [Halobaculum sp. MBLA0143]|uniref:uroporphyrinogen-III synthase n=1 Tax=Halobaculum sp. MBLA0143 TaxID=3079933 RepID=UPI003524CCF6